MEVVMEPVGPYTKWTKPQRTPGTNIPVFGFFPDVGNDDEGYGMVIPIWWDSYHGYRFCGSNVVASPMLWCWMTMPEPPITADTADECISNCLELMKRV